MEFIAYFVALIYLEKCFYTSAFGDRERQRVQSVRFPGKLLEVDIIVGCHKLQPIARSHKELI